MKTPLDLPDELIRAAKMRALMEGRTLKDLVAEFLRQGLEVSPPAQTMPSSPSRLLQIDNSGLPVIQCHPNAPATRMPVSELLKVEQAAQTTEDFYHAGLTL